MVRVNMAASDFVETNVVMLIGLRPRGYPRDLGFSQHLPSWQAFGG